MADFRTAAAIFPLNTGFRELPAIYAVYAYSHRLVSSNLARTEVYKALRFNANSLYLRRKAEELSHEP